MTSQFEGAERIADKWGITREDTDAFGLASQQRAAQAWAEDRFAGQYVAIEAPDLDEDGKPTGTTHTVEPRRGPARDDAREAGHAEAGRPRERRAHRRQLVADLRRRRRGADDDRGEGRARSASRRGPAIVDTCLVGVDPVLMLTGPIDATQRLLDRTGLSIDDIDVFEINEAFASVVLAWAKEVGADLDKTNPNGGAIALGHPLGGTGAFLMTKALYELERTGGRYALVSMCCGGGLGTGTIIERI